MKKYFYFIFVALSLSVTCAHAWPAHTPGTVTIQLVEYDRVYEVLDGHMNVRYNRYLSGNEYIQGLVSEQGAVTFYGEDSDGNTFSCFMTSSTSDEIRLEIARLAAANLRDGSEVRIFRDLDSPYCEAVYFKNSSTFMH